MRRAAALPIALVLLGSLAAHAQTDLVKRGAAITLKVQSFQAAHKALFDLAAKHSGAIADKRHESSEKGHKSGWMRVIVPKTNLDAFLADTRMLGKIYGEQASLNDFTSTYEDLAKRANRLQQHQERLAGVLSNKRLRGSDILFIQERLLRAGTDEDTLAEQRADLPKQAASSSVVVTLFEPYEVPWKPTTPAGHVVAAFQNAGKNMAKNALNSIETIAGLILYAIGFGILYLIFRKPIRKLYRNLRAGLQPATPRVMEERPSA